jgi:porphobilinogen deaminase
VSVQELRGNVPTRVRKLREGGYDASCWPPPGFHA